MKIIAVAGARPNFMKIAPLMWEAARRDDVDIKLIHTGQHYDHRMSELFFEQLRIPRPDWNLEVGSGSHAHQTGEIMKRSEPLLLEEKPDAVLVVGDVNSTIACALTAVKMGIPVAHVEAGLRSFDRSMPEEINRLATDAISHWLFVSEKSGVNNLLQEGIPQERIFFVGNVMIDTLLACRDVSERSTILEDLKLEPEQYALLTLHRPSNVDDSRVLGELIKALKHVQDRMPVIFPVHPRTRSKIDAISTSGLPQVEMIEPQGYLDFMKLVASARVVLTDSGGLQEETTVLSVPCLTLRTSTERPVTLEQGTNVLVKPQAKSVIAEFDKVMKQTKRLNTVPELWDGSASQRILDVLVR